MKISNLILLITLITPLVSFRLLEAQHEVVVVTREVPRVDRYPENDVMVPEQSWVEPPPNEVVEEVIHVVPPPPPMPEPKIVAVVGLTQEQLDSLKLVPREVEVVEVGSSQ